MNKEKEYNFSDFTTTHYTEILRSLKEKFEFVTYDNIEAKTKYVLMRHDVDFSPQRALRIAEIEHKEGVRSTFFWHMHSEFYNLLDKDSFEIVNKIQSLGHEFGIHFDTHFFQIQNEEEIESALEKEKKIVELIFNIQPKVFSFHNTNDFVMGCQKFKYANLVNTYAKYFQKNIKYCSDSNGYWRFDRMIDVVKNDAYDKLHLLTHPENWTEETMSPYEKIKRAINGRASANLDFYNTLLTKAGRKIIS